MKSIFLHFLADFPILLKVNNNELGLIENDCETLSVEICGEQEILVSVFPIAEKSISPSIPYLAKIKIENGVPKSHCHFVEITDFECANFEVKIFPMPILINKKPIFCDSIKLSDELFINVFKSGQMSIEINFKNKVYKYELCEIISDYKAEYYTQNETSFLIFQGKTTKNQQYLVIFSNFFCNLEIVADYIERTKTELTVLNYQHDIARHGVVQKYKLEQNSFVLCDEYTVFLDTTPHRPTDPKIIPWAFAEAINLGDTNLARTYLENGLSKMLSDEHLLSFFGDYSEIKWNKYSSKPNTVCFVYDQNPRKTKTFSFEIVNEKISNITQID